MKTSIPLALALCVATVLATVAVAEINQASKWDFFYLVRQWPASFCNDDPNKCKRPTPNGVFTIHGFWPNRKNGSYPANCDCAYQLDYYQVKDLQMELESVWPSYTKPSSKNSFSFWNYEWIKHGTCAKDILGGQDGQKKYFQQALRLHRELSIEAALKKAGINLVSGQDISTQDIKAAIKNAYGVKPVISCEGNGELKEIYMCIDKQFKPMNCTDPPPTSNSNNPKCNVSPGGRRHLASNTRALRDNYKCTMVEIP